MKFTKMHGIGNDYIYIDCFDEPVPADAPQLAREMAHRHFGIGGDGLVLIRPSESADAWMQMFNADGSESEMCGNAIRCVAKLVYERGIAPRKRQLIQTGNGDLTLDLHVGPDNRVEGVTVDMGPPELQSEKIPTTLGSGAKVIGETVDFDGQSFEVTCVSMGNPHCVIFVDQATDDLVLGLGPKIENDPRFPNRTNVEFVEVIGRDRLRQRTWERGSGETWACGTGAAAVCVAGALTKQSDRKVTIELLGGELELNWDAETDHVMKTGSATEVFQGIWE